MESNLEFKIDGYKFCIVICNKKINVHVIDSSMNEYYVELDLIRTNICNLKKFKIICESFVKLSTERNNSKKGTIMYHVHKNINSVSLILFTNSSFEPIIDFSIFLKNKARKEKKTIIVPTLKKELI